MFAQPKFIKAFVTLFLSATILFGCSSPNDQAKNVLDESMTVFSQVLSSEDLHGMTLTVYSKYQNGIVFTGAPETIEVLIGRIEESFPEDMASMDTASLKENLNLLRQLSEADFEPAEEEVKMDIFYCLVFKTNKQEKILEIAIEGVSKDYPDDPTLRYIYVNGLAVKCSDTVLEILYTLGDQAFRAVASDVSPS